MKFEDLLVSFPASRKGSTMILALGWIIGLIFGSAASVFAGSYLDSLMRGVLYDTVSIVSLLVSSLLPFLIAAFAVYISQPWLLIPLGFLKAFLLSFVSLGISRSFGSAGWLLRLMLLFSNWFTAWMLYGYMHWHLRSGIRFYAAEFFVVVSLCVLVGSVYFAYILPFLADIVYF